MSACQQVSLWSATAPRRSSAEPQSEIHSVHGSMSLQHQRGTADKIKYTHVTILSINQSIYFRKYKVHDT